MRAKIIVQKYDRDGDYEIVSWNTPPIEGAVSISDLVEETYKRTTYTSKKPRAIIDEQGQPQIVYDEKLEFYSDSFFTVDKWKRYGAAHWYDEENTTWHRMVETNDWYIDIETVERYQSILEMISKDEIRYFSKNDDGSYIISMESKYAQAE